MTRYLRLLALPTLALLLLFLSACQVDPEKSPAFTGVLDRLKKVEGEQKKTEKSVEMLLMDGEGFTNDIKALKAKSTAPGASPDTAALLDRISKLEQQVKDLSEAAEQHKKPAPADGAPVAKPEGKPDSAKPAVAPKADGKTTAAKATKTGKTAAGAETTAKPEGTKSKGGAYYQVKQGDTVQSVAQASGIAAADLCKANTPMKPETTLFPGQQIYIPAK
ncbi:TPA: hypothetical protein DDW35_12840 [Candidatus Sumerlaeota bacterium]|jgi:LysM repeat protein|nr:hypothetical protein [Candidatus Sumerlaeota bacterium]